MKKLSFLPVLLLVAACCLLASCGEEESSSVPAVSSEAPAASSEAPATSSEAEPESSEEAPETSEEESQEPGYVKNPDAVSTEGNNVLAGREYTISELFRAEGTGGSWDETYIAFPDEGFELTDGVIPEAAYQDAGWMAFRNSTPAQAERGYAYVKFDLEQSYELSELTVHSLKDSASGIACPYKIEVLVSEENENWYSANVLNIAGDLDGLADNSVHALVAEMDVTGRYVEIRLTSYGWCFLGELELK